MLVEYQSNVNKLERLFLSNKILLLSIALYNGPLIKHLRTNENLALGVYNTYRDSSEVKQLLELNS